MKPHFIILVEGGVVANVICDQPADCTLVDYDIEGVEEDQLVTIPGDSEAVGGRYPVESNPTQHATILAAYAKHRFANIEGNVTIHQGVAWLEDGTSMDVSTLINPS